jgi:5,10-methylene-tetrahydrofolate dehydrogenase/methenyl tetrahydrofolate cyclohydrolase
MDIPLLLTGAGWPGEVFQGGMRVEINLKCKNALITGSSKGIGRAIAVKLAECGANIVVNFFIANKRHKRLKKC